MKIHTGEKPDICNMWESFQTVVFSQFTWKIIHWWEAILYLCKMWKRFLQQHLHSEKDSCMEPELYNWDASENMYQSPPHWEKHHGICRSCKRCQSENAKTQKCATTLLHHWRRSFTRIAHQHLWLLIKKETNKFDSRRGAFTNRQKYTSKHYVSVTSIFKRF